MDILGAQIYTAVQVLLHEIIVALIVISLDRIIFVKVKGSDPRKIQIHLGKTVVHTDRGRPRGKPENTIGLQSYLRADKLRGTVGYFLVAVTQNYSHGQEPSV